MEDLFKQSFNCARITVYRNYSDRLTKNCKSEVFEVYGDVAELDTEQALVAKFTVTAMDKKPTMDFKLYAKSNKNTNFFYTNNPTSSFENHSNQQNPTVHYEPLDLINPKNTIDGKKYFETTKERHIKAHYNNPFSEIEVYKVERRVYRDGDKIKLKYYVSIRDRKWNSKYFHKSVKATTITFNLLTGNFTVVNYTAIKKSRSKQFFSNSFQSIQNGLPAFYNIMSVNIEKNSNIYNEYIGAFDLIPFQAAIQKALNLKNLTFTEPQTTPLNPGAEFLTQNFISEWMNRFVELKKIKVPDTGTDRFLRYYYPTEKFLKKNDRKLVASVLDRFGVKSNVTIKILHQHSSTNIQSLVELCQIFGKKYPKYIGNIDDHFFSGNYSVDKNCAVKSQLLLVSSTSHLNITDDEKEKIVHILNDLCAKTPLDTAPRHAVGMIIDHFNMMSRLNRYFPDIKLNATKWETFNTEHTLYAKYEREIKKGYSTLLVFEREMLLAVEKPIEVLYLQDVPIPIYNHNMAQRKYEECIASWPAVPIEKRVFTPVLLTSSDEYTEEGAYMNHCVAMYISNFDYSVIVSLRWGKERVTCEYQIKNRSCMQQRFFYNQVPPPYFEKALKILDDRMKQIPLPIHALEVKKIPLIINGVQVKPDDDEVTRIMLADIERNLFFQHEELLIPLPQAHIIEQDLPF